MRKKLKNLTLSKVFILVGIVLLVFSATAVFAAEKEEVTDFKETTILKPLTSKYTDSFLEKENTSVDWSLLGSEESLDTGGSKDNTGTDPRDFSSKFMPYYLYTELENGVKVNQFNLFGMYSFTPDLAMTYDWPVFKNLDYSSVFSRGVPGGIGGSSPGTGAGAGAAPPFGDISSSGSTEGYGDLGLRFFYKRKGWGGNVSDQGDTWSWMTGVETTLPTASDDVLGGDTTVISPMFVLVSDIPGEAPFGLGFVALMNFYDFEVDEGKTGSEVERFRGRWFWMQPLSKPGPNLGDGLYILTEFQPVYDFKTGDFDFWFGPEFGKIIKEGRIMYVKPGVGFDRDKTDRKFTLEVGYRYFF